MRKAGVALLAVVAVVAVVVVASSQLRDGSSAPDAAGQVRTQAGNAAEPAGTPRPEADASLSQQVPEAMPPPAGTTTGVMAGGPATGGTGGGAALPLPQVAERKVIRTATLELTVVDVGAAVQEVETAALSVSGFVSGSSLRVEELPRPRGAAESEPPPKRQTATVTIRVPAEAYASVMSRLRGLAQEIRSESSEASEVTEEYTDLEARLRNLQAAEDRYRELLAKAEAIPDILTVQDRLNAVRLEMEQVQGRINLLDSLTDLATITVHLQPPPLPTQGAKAPVEEPEPNWAEEAWENAWEGSKDALETLGTAAITAGVVLVWLLVPGTAILVGWRFLGPGRQRKGEA